MATAAASTAASPELPARLAPAWATERDVQQSLNELAAGRTTLVIAHRLATIQDADRTVVVEGARATERAA